MKRLHFLILGVGLAAGAFGQTQNFFTGSNVTGQLVFTTTVNVTKQAQLAQSSSTVNQVPPYVPAAIRADYASEPRIVRAALQGRSRRLGGRSLADVRLAAFQDFTQATSTASQSLTVGTSSSFGFNGLTAFEQRNANDGNQFDVEPPSEGLAVSNGFVVHGVNNAFQVYNTSGTPLLATALSTNQVFGVSPAINWTTGIYGVYPTDIRVFYDQTMNRWLVLQRAQDYDVFGNALASSHMYLAVSQTDDPTQTYNVYVMNTTDAGNLGCPCIADYPQVAADQYGIYISYNEYDTGLSFLDASILAISKASLTSGLSMPNIVQFIIPTITGFEFAIQPAATPVNASYFIADGGLQYFVSSQSTFSFNSNLAIWAMTNTSSLGTNPNLTLAEVTVPTLSYSTPNPVRQRPGPTPYGTSLDLPLEFIDGGDFRVQSTMYAGGQLWVTLETVTTDTLGNFVTGIAYIIFSPSYRSGQISAPVLRQGILFVTGDHLLRPALAVNPQGSGAIVCTLVGPDYFPSAAFVTMNLTSTGSVLQVAGAGYAPEDGFSGYLSGSGIARWGDYSAAVADSSGSIWMATEYIPNSSRTMYANWGTFITKVVPQ
jgi:hypothetical protein